MTAPKPRKEGQQGGRGGHSKNRELSGRRGGSPGARKPPKKGSGGGSKAMVFLAFLLLVLPASLMALLVGFIITDGYGLI
jgi:hypothetical protein